MNRDRQTDRQTDRHTDRQSLSLQSLHEDLADYGINKPGSNSPELASGYKTHEVFPRFPLIPRLSVNRTARCICPSMYIRVRLTERND